MESVAVVILQIGLGGTFILAGVFILRDKNKWLDMIRPGLRRFLPDRFWRKNMVITAWADIAVGVWLLTPVLTWLAAAFAAFHIVTVLAFSGVTRETFRDIGLLGASAALFFLTF